MRSQKLLLFVYIIMCVILSCKKNTGINRPVQKADSALHIPVGYERTAAINKEVAEILEEVYANDTAYLEVNAAIYSGHYEDERVLLKDLLYPENSELYISRAFRSIGAKAGVFRRIFCEIIAKNRNKYPLMQELLRVPVPRKTYPKAMIYTDDAKIYNDTTSEIFSEKTGVAIYFPYSANFATLNINDGIAPSGKIAMVKKATIVATDRDADAAPGRDPYFCKGAVNNLCFRNVTVNDNYAESQPTHIVTVGSVPVSVSFPESKTSMVNRVYHGWSRLTKQMDRLISLTGNGGGSEIKIGRINGYLKIKNEQVENFDGDLITIHYKRGDIRNKQWKRVYGVWDPDWNSQNIEQVYAVYEEDNKAETTISGSLKTTITLPGKPSLGKVEGEIGFKMLLMTQDEVITQRKIDRKSFFKMGEINQGWGYMKDPVDFLFGNADWPIYDGGAVWGYTMPYQIY